MRGATEAPICMTTQTGEIEMSQVLPITDVYDHPSAWTTATIRSEDDITCNLDRHHVDALLQAMDHARRSGKELEAITRDDFPLSSIDTSLSEWILEVQEGRGLFLLRGLPMDQLSAEDCALLYWGFGAHFGVAKPQSVAGDRLGYVRDESGKNRHSRGYQKRSELSMHTDTTDILAMMSIVQAKTGGLSGCTSGPAIYNYLLKNEPDVLETLCAGFHYPIFGLRKPGSPLITEDKFPIFTMADGYLSISYLRAHIDMAFDAQERSATPAEEHALNTFEALTKDPRFCLRFNMKPGDILFMNNYVLLHDRTEFEDDEEPEKRRLLYRLWLDAFDKRPLHRLASPYIKN